MIHDSLWDCFSLPGVHVMCCLGLAVGVFYVFSLLSNGMITLNAERGPAYMLLLPCTRICGEMWVSADGDEKENPFINFFD